MTAAHAHRALEPHRAKRLGIVVIGRNEGERLRRSIGSIAHLGPAYVYVDSGSTDGSVDTARALGADVVELSADAPFTAARGRNAGFRRLIDEFPDLEYVQFLDGDCELAPDWLAAGLDFLGTTSEVAIVCGNLKERHPEVSIYNRLCELEWAGPVGEIKECGGIALMRVEAFKAVGGYREDLISGEEPDLCFRLRRRGARIWRLDVQMAWHDAGMTRFGQWWRRMVRSGHGYTRGIFFYAKSPERTACVHHVGGSLFWGAGLPLAILASAWLWGPIAFCAFLVYPLQVLRIKSRTAAHASPYGWSGAFFTVLDKFPHAVGILKFLSQRYLHREARLIEYK